MNQRHPKILTMPECRRKGAELRRGYGVVTGATSGCYDILHIGHVRMLRQARDRCTRLFVFVNSDASVRRLKGPKRPINSLEERLEMLAALSIVDYVVPFCGDTPKEAIKALKPTFWFKGGDYKHDDLPERSTVEAHGGTVVILSYVEGHSTTALHEVLRSSMKEG